MWSFQQRCGAHRARSGGRCRRRGGRCWGRPRARRAAAAGRCGSSDVRPEAVVRILQRPRAEAGDEALVERIAAEQIVHHVDHAVAIARLAGEARGQAEQHRAVEQVRVRAPAVIGARRRAGDSPSALPRRGSRRPPRRSACAARPAPRALSAPSVSASVIVPSAAVPPQSGSRTGSVKKCRRRSTSA